MVRVRVRVRAPAVIVTHSQWDHCVRVRVSISVMVRSAVGVIPYVLTHSYPIVAVSPCSPSHHPNSHICTVMGRTQM